MSLKPFDRVRKSISFRLALWYSIFCIASPLTLFGLMYFFLSSYLHQRDREIIQAKIEECIAQYRNGGLEALKKEVRLEKHVDRKNASFIRIAGRNSETLFLSVPDHWKGFNVSVLENRKISKNEEWIRFKVEDQEDDEIDEKIEAASIRLSDDLLLQVGKSTKNREEILELFGKVFAAIMIPVTFFGLAGGAFLSFRALRPVRRLIQTVRSIETGKMNARVPVVQTGDELQDLTILFNGMLEKIEKLINGMKAALDNVAHDLRTPMARLLNRISEVTLQREADATTLREKLMDCAEETQQMLTTLNMLMDISEAESGVMKLSVDEVNVSILIEDVVELYRYVAEDKNVDLSMNAPKELCLNADRGRIRQVLANLLDNAIKYTPRGGKVEIEAFSIDHRIVLRVIDTGEGIPAHDLPKIWDRLYRVDKSRSRKGFGLGLSLVKAVVNAHQGNVEVSSEPSKGSQFTVYLPASNQPLMPSRHLA